MTTPTEPEFSIQKTIRTAKVTPYDQTEGRPIYGGFGQPYFPVVIIPPGMTVFEMALHGEWTEENLRLALGLDHETFWGLIVGKTPITSGLADRLTLSLGATPGFWLNLERHYQDDKQRLGQADYPNDDDLQEIDRRLVVIRRNYFEERYGTEENRP